MKEFMKRFVSTTLIACLVVGTFIVEKKKTQTAYAADTNYAIQLVENGDAPNIKGKQLSSVRFGNYSQSKNKNGGYNVEPIKWRVLENKDKRLFLLTDQNIDSVHYQKDGSHLPWEKYQARKWLNGYDQYDGGGFINNAFSKSEQAAIILSNLEMDTNPDYPNTDQGNNTQDKIFTISLTDALNTEFGFSNDVKKADDKRKTTNTTYAYERGKYGNSYPDNRWMLRTKGQSGRQDVEVKADGSINLYGFSNGSRQWPIRPGMNLDLNSVLFTSASPGGKSSGTEGINALKKVSTGSISEWKMTLIDNGSIEGLDGHKDFTVTSSTNSVNTATIKYTGATTGTNEYISAIVKNSSGNITYYGRIKKCSSANDSQGTITINIQDKISSGDTLYVFNEQVNGDGKTDFASELKKVEVKSKGTLLTPFTIASPDDWDALAEYVSKGNKTSGVYFRLGDNITTSTMVGTSAKPFEGIIDGKGYTLTFNKNSSSENCAPFQYINNARIVDLHIAGTITTNKKFAAGLAARAQGKNVIQGCRSSMVINSSVDGDGTHGGFIAVGGAQFTGCVFDGKITGSKTTLCGGFVGWADPTDGCEFYNCLFAPAEISIKEALEIFARHIDENTIIERCFYTKKLDRTQGKAVYKITPASKINVVIGGEEKYDASKLIVYYAGVQFNGTYYAAKGAQVLLGVPSVCDEITSSAGTLKKWNDGMYELSMPEKEVSLSLNEGKFHDWKFDKFVWEGNVTDGYTSKAANYICNNNAEHTKSITQVTVSTTVINATCTTDGKTVYTAKVLAKDSPDGKEHSESKDAKPVGKKGHDWGEWKTSIEPSVGKDGERKRVCKNDSSHFETEKIPALTVPATTIPETTEPEEVTSSTETEEITTPAEKKEITKPGKTKVKKAVKKKKSAKKIKIRLKKVKGVKGYQVAVYKSKKNAKKNKKAIKKKYFKKIKFTLKSKKFKKYKKLFVKARAYKLNGKIKIFGKWSKIKKVKIK